LGYGLIFALMSFQYVYALLFGSKLKAFVTISMATLCIAIFNSPYTHAPHYDIEVFRHIGMNIYKGFVPYRDAFDHKPPLVYFIAAMLYPLGIWGNWFFGVFCASAAAYFLWLLSRHYKFTHTWVLPAVLLFLFFWQRELIGRYADTRFFTTVFMCILLYLILVKTNKFFIVKGILSALVFAAQQNEILIAALLLTLNFKLLYNESLSKALNAFGKISIGFFCIIGVLLLYFWVHNAVSDLYYGVFKFNATYFLKPIGFSVHLFRIKQFFIHSFVPKFFVALLLSFIVGGILNRRKPISGDLLIFTVLITITSLYNITLSGYYWMYYTFHLIMPCILLLLCIIYWLELAPISNNLKVGLLSVIVLSIMARRATVSDMYSIFRKYKFSSSLYYDYYANFNEDMQKVANKPNSLFVLNDFSALCMANKYGIKLRSRWVINYFWNEGFSKFSGFDKSGAIFYNEILEPLKQDKPDYLIFVKDYFKSPDLLRTDLKKEWESFVNSNYVYSKGATLDTFIVMYKLRQ
jgi:hypothetical protein